MANIDFLVHNSTKKILKLIKGLPDAKKIEAAFKTPGKLSTPSSPKSISKRFTTHPRHCHHDEGGKGENILSDSTSESHEEVVVIKTPRKTSSLHSQPDSSDDEYWDVTVRTEDPVDFSLSLEERLGKMHLGRCNNVQKRRFTRTRPKSAKRNKIHKRKVVLGERKGKVTSCSISSRHETQSVSTPIGPRKNNLFQNPPAEPVPSPRDNLKSHSELQFQAKETHCCQSEDGHACAIADPESVEFDVQKEAAREQEMKVKFDLKLKTMLDRSMILLTDCRAIFETGIEPPDGRDDYERRKKRCVAFNTRFSRNYLYQLARNKIEIENYLNPFGKSSKAVNSFVIGQRFYNACQTIYLALDAYKKHFSISLLNGMPPKFRELLEYIVKFIDLLRSSWDPLGNDAAADTMYDYCKSMLADPSLISSRRVSSASISFASRRRGATSISSGPSSNRRLAMYEAQKNAIRKNAMRSRQKYQVASKYKTATFKHRPPPQSVSAPSALPRHKPKKNKAPYVEPLQLGDSCETIALKKKRSRMLKINDMDSEVSTFIEETIYDNQVDRFGECENLRLYAQEFYNKVTKGKQEMNEEEYGCILDHFLEIIGEKKTPDGGAKPRRTQQILERRFGRTVDVMSFADFVNKLIQHACGSDKKKEYKDPPTTPVSGSSRTSQKCTSETILASGPANAKLIFMKEGVSPAESVDVVSQIQCIDPDGELLNKLSKLSVTHQSDSNELIYKIRADDERDDLHRDSIPTKRTRKSKKMALPLLPPLAKDAILRLIEYKLDYHRESKENFLYKKNADFATWHVVSHIADILMDETLLSIARDIQVEHILQKIYAQEFK